GWLAGAGAGALAAAAAGSPAGGVLAHSLATGGGVAVAVGAAAVAAVLLLLALRAPALRMGALSLNAIDPGAFGESAALGRGPARFASVYRWTLTRTQADEAAFAVPADYVVREDLARLVTPFEAAPPSAFRRLGDPLPVVRTAAAVGDRPLALLGVPARA